MEKLRGGVCDKLEPLTMGLSTSIVVRSIKRADHKGLLEYVRKPESAQLYNRRNILEQKLNRQATRFSCVYLTR